ncbi:salicylate hydroxylase [Emericellopsis atlantica]|uniref:Salicylate hydroxylase n=1 Tax=Emericellopsis atlantica TaxID=2614577 RepID=A0A9P8CMK2_9HYPO|nr:salicylate hydroxylase [Emericellopsis atlantica]KAG9250771.1 salicylate hydroxylase [Emericellopsis atlantica]
MALHKKGVPFTVYEEAAEYSVVGAGIGFAPNGLLAMDLIEPGFRPLYEDICVGNKPKDAQWVFFEGMLLEPGCGVDKPWSGNLRSAWGHSDYTRKSAHRKNLLDIMSSFIPIENVKFSKRVTSVKEDVDGVVLEFADSEVATASVVAAADGIASTLRSYVLGKTHPEQVKPVYADAYCYRAVISMAEAEEILGDRTHVAKLYFGKNKAAVTYRITEGKEFNFLLCKATPGQPWPHGDKVTHKITHEEMMTDFDGPDVDDRFRQLLTKAKPVRWGFFHHWRTATYYKGRVALLGDSAHASLPFHAAGAAQGIEDALILSNVLAVMAESSSRGAEQLPEIRAGLKSFDAVRRPRAQKQLEGAARTARMLYFQDEEAGEDMREILKSLQGDRFNWLWFHDLQADVDRAVNSMRTDLNKSAL